MNGKSESNRWWDVPAVLILLFAIYLAAMRLSATEWTDELDIVQTITVLGVASGLALGLSSFSRRGVQLLGASYGLFVLGWQIGSTFGKGVLWVERLASILGRLEISFGNLFRERAVTDPILFLFLMGLLFWILSTHAGYSLTRHGNAWQATLPTGVAIFIIHIYDPFWPNRTWFIASYIFLALLLLARLHFLKNRQRWKENRAHIPPYAGLDFLRATMLAGGMLVLLAWTAPALAATVPPAQQAWQTLARPWFAARAKMSNAFASLRATVGIVQDYYGENLPLGRGNTLTDTVVFTVQAPPRPAAGVRYYWRARVYDFYDGTQWRSSPTEVVQLTPDEPALPFANLEGRWETTFTFIPGIPLNTVYTVPQPQWVSRPVSAKLIKNPDNTIDLFSMQTTPTIRPGEVYQVQSSLTNVTVNQLRAAGTEYPDWIVERYLQLPDTLTPRTLRLAQEIAGDLENPYDIAETVTQWLRENIAYRDTVPIPPQDQDILDWMLFDLRQGFCNYYATAEVIMLRSLGVPARLAVGYAQGQRDPETNTYTVRQRDAHAWPEVYFPGIGWVEFEPTLNQRPLRRPLGDPVQEDNTASPSASRPNAVEEQDLEALLGAEAREDQSAPEEAPTPRSSNRIWLLPILIGASLVAISLFAWRRTRLPSPENIRTTSTPLPVKIEQRVRAFGIRPPAFLRRWAYNASLPPQAKAYQELNRSLIRLKTPPPPNYTPAERGSLLNTILPEASQPINVLIREYHLLKYANSNSPNGESAYAALQAARTLRTLTWVSIGKRLLARFQDPNRKRKTFVEIHNS